MIISVKKEIKPIVLENIIQRLRDQNVSVDLSEGTEMIILGCIGDTKDLDVTSLAAHPDVLSVKAVSNKFEEVGKKKNKKPNFEKFNLNFASDKVVMIAGPCSIESKKQLTTIVESIKDTPTKMIRGGAFKPRTSPYSFQGLGEDGLLYLNEIAEDFQIPVISEIMKKEDIALFEEQVDVLQVGARNMQNYDLLKALGNCKKPVMLKRGFANTVDEWLLAAEYIIAHGNPHVILCERGIRTFETRTRNTLDLSVVPLVKSLTDLPVVVDPSHATGDYRLIEPMALAAIAAGADGLMIEVHHQPEKALSDGAQSLTPKRYKSLIKKAEKVAQALGKSLY